MNIPYPFVSVDWADTKSTPGWIDPKDLNGPWVCRTVGWLVPTQNAACITVAACLQFTDAGAAGDISLVDEIPVGCVLMIRMLDNIGKDE